MAPIGIKDAGEEEGRSGEKEGRPEERKDGSKQGNPAVTSRHGWVPSHGPGSSRTSAAEPLHEKPEKVSKEPSRESQQGDGILGLLARHQQEISQK